MGLLRRLEQRSAENPSTSLSNPAAWLYDAFGATKAKAGVRVSPKSALTLSTYFACIRVRSEDLSTLPVQVFEYEANGRKRAPTHPLERILGEQPNPEMNAIVFYETLQAHLDGWGNAYAEIETNGRGEVIALWPLLPDRTEICLNDRGEKVCKTEVRDPGGYTRQVTLPMRRVFHVHGLGFDGLKGYSVAGLARESIALSMAAEEFGARFFANGANMGLVATHPQAFKNKDTRTKLKERIEEMTTGLKNAHRVFILEEGIKLEKLGIPQGDAQFMELRQFQNPDVCRWFRMPPHKVQDLTRSTNNNIEHQSIEYVTDCIRPPACRWELAFRTSLFSQRDRGRFVGKFNLAGLLRGDLKSRYDAYAVGRQWGWLSVNDVREKEEMNQLEAAIGNRYLYPTNMSPADRMDDVVDSQLRKGSTVEGQRQLGPGPVGEQTGSDAALMRALREVLRTLLHRALQRELVELRRLIPVWRSKKRSATEIGGEIERLYRRLGDLLAEDLQALERSFPTLVPGGFARACGARQARWASDQVAGLLAVGGDPLAAIEARMAEWESHRTEVSTRIEVEALGAGRIE